MHFRNKPFEMQTEGVGVLPRSVKEAFDFIINSAKQELGLLYISEIFIYTKTYIINVLY